MADSNSFSSLFALVDNHLSKCNIRDESQPSTSGIGSFKLPSLGVQRGLSDTGLPSTSGLSYSSTRFPIPSLSLSERPINNALARQLGSMFNSKDKDLEEETDKPTISMSDCPINDVLAIQLSNMLKAREAKEEEKRQQELKKLEENIQMEESSCLIDLMPAVQLPGQVQIQHINTLSSGSSMESIIIPDTSDIVEDEQQVNTDPKSPSRPESPLKPISRDMRYILEHKIGKCSEFGKVLCARYRPVAAPYFREYVPTTHIKVFDFSTPSPDDIVQERLRKPSFYSSSHNTLTLYDEIMSSISED